MQSASYAEHALPVVWLQYFVESMPFSCENPACILTEHALCVGGQVMPLRTMLLLELLYSRENSTSVLYAVHVLFLGLNGS